MTHAIILPELCTGEQIDRIWDDFMEAVRYGVETPVVLERFDKNGLPVYHATGFLKVERYKMTWSDNDNN